MKGRTHTGRRYLFSRDQKLTEIKQEGRDFSGRNMARHKQDRVPCVYSLPGCPYSFVVLKADPFWRL